MFLRHLHNAIDAKTFLKHFSDCLFYFCSTCADSITSMYCISIMLHVYACVQFILYFPSTILWWINIFI